jgi:hypothetical protein
VGRFLGAGEKYLSSDILLMIAVSRLLLILRLEMLIPAHDRIPKSIYFISFQGCQVSILPVLQ